jgi:hypothetical protein
MSTKISLAKASTTVPTAREENRLGENDFVESLEALSR